MVIFIILERIPRSFLRFATHVTRALLYFKAPSTLETNKFSNYDKTRQKSPSFWLQQKISWWTSKRRNFNMSRLKNSTTSVIGTFGDFNAGSYSSTYDVVKNQPPSASFNPFVPCNDGCNGTAADTENFLINSLLSRTKTDPLWHLTKNWPH